MPWPSAPAKTAGSEKPGSYLRAYEVWIGGSLQCQVNRCLLPGSQVVLSYATSSIAQEVSKPEQKPHNPHTWCLALLGTDWQSRVSFHDGCLLNSRFMAPHAMAVNLAVFVGTPFIHTKEYCISVAEDGRRVLSCLNFTSEDRDFLPQKMSGTA